MVLPIRCCLPVSLEGLLDLMCGMRSLPFLIVPSYPLSSHHAWLCHILLVTLSSMYIQQPGSPMVIIAICAIIPSFCTLFFPLLASTLRIVKMGWRFRSVASMMSHSQAHG